MRQLLLAALVPAGSLLVGLPALAQLSNTTSTFSGQVAATCLISMSDNITLLYNSRWNYLAASDVFQLTANASQVRLSIDRLNVNNEPVPTASEIAARVDIDFISPENNLYAIRATKASGAVETFLGLDSGVPNSFNVLAMIDTAQQSNGRYELPPGEYSYTATISCLQ